MRPRKKVVWTTQRATQEAGTKVPTHHLGRFSQPGGINVEPFEAEHGSLWMLRDNAKFIGDPWAGSEIEEGSLPYVAVLGRPPSPRSTNLRDLPAGTLAIFSEVRRLTEWDGRGFSRPERPLFIIDGCLVAVVDPMNVLVKV